MSFNVQEVERERAQVQTRPKLYDLVKREMQRRGRWKLEDRGARPPIHRGL